MSDENKNSESFDFDFNSHIAEGSQGGTGEGSFDLDNPFGDGLVVLSNDKANLPEHYGGDSFDLNDPAGDGFAAFDDGLSADNPYVTGGSEVNTVTDERSPISLDKSDKKKKGGWFSKGKDTPRKEKAKKEKRSKEEVPAGEPMSRDWGTILCVAFSLFLLVSLLIFNVAALLTRGPDSTIMQTLCFLGAFNLIGLVAAAVPILLYNSPKERTLPNIMLGIAAVALFGTVMIAVTEFYRYGFIMKP